MSDATGGEFTDSEFGRPVLGRIVRYSDDQTNLSRQVFTRPGRLLAYHLVEPTATSGVDALFYDGSSAADTKLILIPADLTAGAHSELSFTPYGVPVENGCWLQMSAGKLTFVLWVMH